MVVKNEEDCLKEFRQGAGRENHRDFRRLCGVIDLIRGIEVVPAEIRKRIRKRCRPESTGTFPDVEDRSSG